MCTFICLQLFLTAVWAESDTFSDSDPYPAAASKYTGHYSSAYMPYVPFRYAAYDAPSAAYNPAFEALAAARRQPKRFHYGIPAGGLYMANFRR